VARAMARKKEPAHPERANVAREAHGSAARSRSTHARLRPAQPQRQAERTPLCLLCRRQHQQGAAPLLPRHPTSRRVHPSARQVLRSDEPQLRRRRKARPVPRQYSSKCRGGRKGVGMGNAFGARSGACCAIRRKGTDIAITAGGRLRTAGPRSRQAAAETMSRSQKAHATPNPAVQPNARGIRGKQTLCYAARCSPKRNKRRLPEMELSPVLPRHAAPDTLV